MIMEPTKILVADDNPEIREIIRILLSGEGYDITEAPDGRCTVELICRECFDLVILDIMMPDKNGYQVCIEIREHSNVPILFLTAKSQESDKTLGFSSGGDDYLTKPFSYSELVSRVKALLRRYQVYRGKTQTVGIPTAQTDEIIYRNLTLYPTSRESYKDNQPLDLTDTEYEILLLLVTHRGQIFSAEHLYEAVWDDVYYYGANNTIMVHIRNLRRKLEENPANPTIIKTIWGKGYRCD